MLTKIWTPPPVTLAQAPVFTTAELDRYERDILTNPRATEHDASRLFRELPKFLYMGQGAEIRPEVVLYRPDGTPQRVDFFRRSYGKQFWDIIELKHPNKSFVTAELSPHPRVSTYVETAINQALDYRELINEDSETRAQLLRRGILVYRPQIIVIVGKHGCELRPEKLEALYDRIRCRGPIDAYSYEDIYEFALEHFRSNQVRVTLASAVFSPEPIIRPTSRKSMTPREVGQKIYTDMESADLTGICVTHLHEISEHRNLGFIMRAEDPVDKRAGQLFFTLKDLMILATMFPRCTHRVVETGPRVFYENRTQTRERKKSFPQSSYSFLENLWGNKLVPLFTGRNNSRR